MISSNDNDHKQTNNIPPENHEANSYAFGETEKGTEHELNDSSISNFSPEIPEVTQSEKAEITEANQETKAEEAIWQDNFGSTIKSLSGMYRSWFLDYASYVILERAIPHIDDGLKPVQRRVLHAMNLLENGHLHKVAKIVGQTMAFHPHGDASINDALVQLGQKELLIDTQGNWGNIFTGDDAAAGRYIEAKLSPFALETVFDSKITVMKKSYDGTADEPESLPVRFPLLLAQGAEGIAVGLSSKIYPHNPKELIEAAINYLEGNAFELYPDFKTGGLLDVDRYNDGLRGGVLRCRARIERIGERTISITELPYGKTTSTLIDSILKANEKGQIKIKHIDDMTAAQVDIRIQLPSGVSTDKTIDGLYAFTDCEVSLSPNACVIKDEKPVFLGVSDLLKYSTNQTKKHFAQQLKNKLSELQGAHLQASLERIFIEERIYKDKEFEEANNETSALNHIRERIESIPGITFITTPKKEDYKRLLELKMARILKFNREKHDKLIARLERDISETNFNIEHLVEYTVEYYKHLNETYFANEERKTLLTRFSNIVATKVIEANEKLYFDREGGFAGTGIKNGEFIANCSLLDDMIIFFRNGTYTITKIEEKKFIGKGEVLHIDKFVRGDKRTIYNLIYRDGSQGAYYIKRFFVTGVTRDKQYDATNGTKGSRVVYFSVNPNGEAEVVRITLKPRLRLRNLVFEKDFSEIAIRGRATRGNLVTKVAIQRIALKERGSSTLGGRKVWFDNDVKRINFDNQGTFIGEFEANDLLLIFRNDGSYYTAEVSESAHFSTETNKVERFDPAKIWTAIYVNSDNELYLKRFTLNEQNNPLPIQGEGNQLLFITDHKAPIFDIILDKGARGKAHERIDGDSFVGVKSVNAKGKRISTFTALQITNIAPTETEQSNNEEENDNEVENGGNNTTPEHINDEA